MKKKNTILPPADTEFMTIAEAAKFFRVTPKTVYAWKYSGKLKTFKLAGRLVRIRTADVMNLFEGKK